MRMSKRRLLFLVIVLLLSGGLLVGGGLPLLKAIPPRYVARLPEPLQAIAAPADPDPILPTAAAPVNADSLLQSADTDPAVTAAPIAAPATPTPPAVAGQAVVVSTPAKPTTTATAVPPTPTPTATPLPFPAAARLPGYVDHQFQTWNNCGPTTLAMTLSYFGLHLTQSETAAVLKPNPEDRNVGPEEMAAFVNNETPFAAITRTNGDFDTIRRFIAHDIPVILEIGIEPPGEYRWMGWYGHYLLVVAYDDALQQFWVYDSWFGTSDTPGENAHRDGRILTYADAAEHWPQFNRNYLAVYRPEQAETVAAIIGANMDDATMWQNALERVRAETTAANDNAFNWFNLGTIYNHLGDYERAASAFDQARAIGLPWRMLWYQFGPYEAYYQVGRYEDVLLLADVTLKDRPYFEESFYYKGLALAAMGQTAEARHNLQEAARFNPNFTLATAALTQLEGNP